MPERLTTWPRFTKICGLTRKQDFDLVAELGFDAAGFIFAEASKRRAVVNLVAECLSPKVLKVGVFVDQSLDFVRRCFHEGGLDIVQLHGSESIDYVEHLGLTNWKALPVTTELPDFSRFGRNTWSQACLLDCKSGAGFGGTGESFDWSLLAKLNTTTPVIVAGGIGLHNISELLGRREAFGIDLSSGVEVSPGVKDHQKLRKLAEVLLAET